ncbi:MAG: [Oscillospiraceae bacterium]|nr:[FeFe] hydrogenase H-cluster maturation GTPase HydF [Oscillospiraceae bacterium]
MGNLNETVSAERLHIAFFGKRNAGKSSLVNAVTAQKLAVVSPVPGTTTDPVKKAMELLPLGPVVIIDTPGYDDEGDLGSLRVEKTNEVLNKTDIAVLVYDASVGMTEEDRALLDRLKERKLPVILTANKSDLPVAAHSVRHEDAAGVGAAIGRPHEAEASPICHSEQSEESVSPAALRAASLPEAATKDGGCGSFDSAALRSGRHDRDVILVSALTGEGVNELKERLAELARTAKAPKYILADLVAPGDMVILVIPIDESAPKGRLILPQQLTLRELLDLHCVPICCQVEELPGVLGRLKTPPRLVVTDSQAFGRVSPLVPSSIPLSSFSILFARYKGELRQLAEGARALSSLKDGDHVLISEGCTHHRQCNDIGSVKIPGWVRKYTGKELEFSFSSGGEFPEDLSGFDLVIHCGGCMLNEAAMKHRMEVARRCGVPMVNYGVAIAQMHGILARSLVPFKGELSD